MAKKIKFYHRLYFRISISILIPSVILSVFMIALIYKTIENLTEEEYLNFLQDVNFNYTNYIDTKFEDIASKAKLGAIYLENGSEKQNEFLQITKDIVISDQLIYGSAIALKPNSAHDDHLEFYYSYRSHDTINQIQFSDSSSPFYFDYTSLNLEWWTMPSATFRSGWTKPYFDREAGQTNMITYYQPFFTDGNFVGIVTIDVSLDQLRILLKSKEQSFEYELSSNVFLVSRDSILIYTDDHDYIGYNIFEDFNVFPDSKYINEKLMISDILAKKAGNQVFYSQNLEQNHVAFYTPIPSTKWYSISIIPYSAIENAVYEQMSGIFYALILIIIIIILLIVILTKSIVKPIDKLSQQSLKIAEGEYLQLIDIKNKSEIGQLSTNFNSMSKKLKSREDALVKANKELLELDDAKNKFLLLISHEIRTPLNGIIGLTSLIGDSIKDEETLEYMDLLEESIDRLNDLSKRSLEIIQMQVNSTKIDKETIPIEEIVLSILSAYQAEIQDQNIKLTLRLEPDLIHHGIQQFFTGTLEELIKNAINHCLGDKEIIIKTYSKESKSYISFENTGIPIPEDKLDEILKPFGLAEKHMDKNIGLGLHYVKTYVELMGADLQIESHTDKTAFILVF